MFTNLFVPLHREIVQTCKLNDKSKSEALFPLLIPRITFNSEAMTNEEFIESIRLEGEEWRNVVGWEDFYKALASCCGS